MTTGMLAYAHVDGWSNQRQGHTKLLAPASVSWESPQHLSVAAV